MTYAAAAISPTIALPMEAFDEPTFTRWVERHQRAVLAVAFAWVGDRATAEEVAQEALLVAWVQLRDGKRVEREGAWLCGIARNLARNARRKTRVTVEVGEVVAEGTPHDELVQAESLRSLRAALDELAPNYREPLVLFYLGESSVEGVAQTLALDEDVVRQRLSRGRQQMRELATNERRFAALRPMLVLGALATASLWSRASQAAPIATSSMLGGLALKVGLVLVLATSVGIFATKRRSAIVPRLPAPIAATTVDTPPPSTTAHAVTPKVASRGAVPTSQPEGEGLQRPVDLELNQMTASDVFNMIGEACDVPIVVAPGITIDSLVNLKSNGRPGIEVLDELLAQAGAARSPLTILTIGRGLGPTALDGSRTLDLNLDGALLEDAVATIAAALGEPIYLPGSVGKTLVHAKLTNVTPQVALETILQPVGMGFERRAGLSITFDSP